MPDMCGVVRGRVSRLEDRVPLIGEPETGELRDFRQEPSRQPRGREQCAALRTQRAPARRLGRRRNRGLAAWTQHRCAQRYKCGAAGPRFARGPRAAPDAAGELQLVSILPRLGARRGPSREKKPFWSNELAGVSLGARRLHVLHGRECGFCSLPAGATPVIRAEGCSPMPSGRFPPVSSARAATRAPLVVIADAQEWFSRALETVLVPGGYSVLKAYTAPGLLRQIETSEPDAVILAVDLPGGDGLNLCRLLRADDRVTPSTPIILTQPSPTNRRQMLAALRAGAGDLWGQQLDAEELLLRLAAQLRAKAHADHAWAEGLVDAATQLYNARGLARRVRELAAEARRRAATAMHVEFLAGYDAVADAAAPKFDPAALLAHASAALATATRDPAGGRIRQYENGSRGA